jgi:hypothetical protein
VREAEINKDIHLGKKSSRDIIAIAKVGNAFASIVAVAVSEITKQTWHLDIIKFLRFQEYGWIHTSPIYLNMDKHKTLSK